MIPSIEDIVRQVQADMIAETEREWLKQIHIEYSSICYQYGVRLRPVIFSISRGQSTWGQWDPVTRCISLSQDLILTESWQNVIGILKHEMAHQYADEVLKINDIHGDAFQTACKVLAVPNEFRHARVSTTKPLQTWRKSNSLATENSILRKAEKLLSLAQSENEHEAYLAMEKVQALFLKHNICKEEIKQKCEFFTLVIDTQKKRIDKACAMIASILNEFYFVRVIFSSTFDTRSCESTKTLEVVGTRENVLMAEYVYHFLQNTLASLWTQYKQREFTTNADRTPYFVGVLTGFRDKLSQIHSSQCKDSSSKSLMKSFQRSLDSYVDTIFPKLTTRKSGGITREGDSYFAGMAEGENIVIHKGVNEKRAGEKRFLNEASQGLF
jgi:hypothetical protein